MYILTKNNSIANHFLAELRSEEIQKDSMRFRKNLERLGEILAYEISKTFPYHKAHVKTPLGKAPVNLMNQNPVLATILRAGIPFYQGFLNYFDKSGSAFVAAYRASEIAGREIEVKMEYFASPSLKGQTLILIDPMLATGKSLWQTYESLVSKYGKPGTLHVASVIASRPGIEFLKSRLQDFSLWVGDVDDELNDKSYIVPGLGDAGDLAFGAKL
jgi:uracil phosphoribosyltransferase